LIIPLPFTSPKTNLAEAGGKGANLAYLTRLGFPVPPGFIVPTEAYRLFVTANGLAEKIQVAIAGLTVEDPPSLEKASTVIRAAFSAGVMPFEIRLPILEAYANLEPGTQVVPTVSVRSSATAEDLPDLSFAGQQDTFLNISGEDQLLEAVVNCWSSLWTGRAIGYRIRNGISHSEVALAVIIQGLVDSAVSGVLFTANPLTGLLSEAVIDATFGLGEALVSGQVEPDHIVVDTLSGEIKSITLGTKRLSTRRKPGGGVESVQEDAASRQSLSENEIKQLVALGKAVQSAYGSPQDIEWAYAGGNLYLLQSRPITSLFPVPKVSFDPLIIWISFGAVQGLVGPMTPLGRDLIQFVLMGAGKTLGVSLKHNESDVMVPAGERIWIKISDFIRNPIGTRLFSGLLEFIEPRTGQILTSLAADPRLGAGKGKLKLSTLRRLARFFLPVAVSAMRTMLNPEKARARFEAVIEEHLRTVQIDPASDRFGRLANLLAYIHEHDRVTNALPFIMPRFLPVFAPSMAAFNLLGHITAPKDGRDHGFSSLALEVTRGLPNNVTTQMDLALWETARTIRGEAEAERIFQTVDAPRLASLYLMGLRQGAPQASPQGALPPASQVAITRFMDKYGTHGVGEIDLGQPRWNEDPTPVMHTLKSYLQIDPNLAPDVIFAQGEKAAQGAIEKLAAEARKQPGGWLKEKVVRALARRIRVLMGARESPKFYAIRTMGVARRAFLEAGDEFVKVGTINRPDDLFFLFLPELEAFSRGEDRDWKALIAERRSIYARELRRRQVPRVLVSDGRAFYEGLGVDTDNGNVITGSPVSPGVAEGIVHVVLDPRQVQLAPGEILVCPGTDPAWTPLFMAAGGLITEVGGMMTHGSVVAREYGIPAVVGVYQATQRLKDGQRIRLDGTLGKIVLLEN